ncbi:MAG: hypothetical protein GKR89_30865 [Candidatus Latescibacteria bacterium]|nr:hypothetical protein [Candidatus Latescibacterota bacterium]
MQLRPHFLFNTLNSISSLMAVDPEAADTMLAKLGDFLRFTLDHAHRDFISLQEELLFARHYLGIEEVRFKDRLQVTFAVEPEARAGRVPNMLLQPLVENAVGHGIAEQIEAGRIEVGGRCCGNRLEIWVSDSGPGLTTTDEEAFSSGIGLANTRDRLRQAYGDNFLLALENGENGGLRVRLQIPFQLHQEDPS